MNFYTADLHFGHEYIMRLCERPFSDIQQMNETLIANWNSVVSDADTVYILGDFSYRSPVSMKPILKRLRGQKHLILGNHDKGWIKNVPLSDYFVSVSDYKEIDEGQTHITLCHYPLLSWNSERFGGIHIHGHIHNDIRAKSAFDVLKNATAYNAGVDVNNFFPVTLEQLIENKRRFYASVGTTAEYETAMCIARHAHMGQKDKTGADYILHPIKVSEYCVSERAKIVALLHDVVEDSPMTLEDLREKKISEDILFAVDLLTKKQGQSLDEYLSSVALNDLALEVKLCDMRHNSEKQRWDGVIAAAQGKQKQLLQDKADELSRRYLSRAACLVEKAGKDRARTLVTGETAAYFINIF